MAISKQLTGLGNEKAVTGLVGANAHIVNFGGGTAYVSKKSGIVPKADGVSKIPAGMIYTLRGISGTVFLDGDGELQIEADDYENPPYSSASGGGTSTEAISAHIANTAIHVDKGQKDCWNSLSNPNLLINPDFRVNTSGKTEYHGVSSVMDCWTTAPGNTVKYLNGGARAIDDGTASYNCLLGQSVKDFAPLKGMTVTFSIKIREITGRALLQMYDGVSWPSSEVFTAPGTYHVTAAISADATRLDCNLVHGLNEAVDVTADWMKLELGGCVTPFKAPVYSDEVMRIKALGSGE